MEVITRFGDKVFARDVSASVAGADRRPHDQLCPKMDWPPREVCSGSRSTKLIVSRMSPLSLRSSPSKRTLRFGSEGPCVDGSGLARRIFTLRRWSEQPCVRPFCAVLMTAGHNALRGSGPDHKDAFE